MVRLSTVLGFTLAAASVFPGVLSQTTAPPACALTCATQAASASGCSVQDTNCICNSASFATTGGECLAAQCSTADQQAAQSYFLALCSDATGTSSTSSGTDTSTDTATSTDTSTDTSTAKSSTTTDTATTTTTTPLTTATSTSTSTSSTPTTTSPTSSRSAATVVSSSTTSSTSKPSNHAMHNQPAGVWGAGLALALALFA